MVSESKARDTIVDGVNLPGFHRIPWNLVERDHDARTPDSCCRVASHAPCSERAPASLWLCPRQVTELGRAYQAGIESQCEASKRPYRAL